MAQARLDTVARILKGFIAMVLLTLILMMAAALAAVYLQLSDNTIRWINQIIKVLSILFGVRITVGRGGENGFITGVVLAVIYMVAGYALYLVLGGNVFNAADMLGEILIGAAVGGAAGAVLANMKPSKKRRKH